MIKKNKRMLALVLACALVTMLIGALPMTAGAATGPVTIDVSLLGGSNVDNGADVATDSQWVYDASMQVLYLQSVNGNYTLIGTNSSLIVVTVFSGQTIVLDGLDVTAPTTAGSVFAVTANNTITLVGSNALRGGVNRTLAVGDGVSCTINGTGSLLIDGGNGMCGIQVGTGGSLTLVGTVSVTAVGLQPVLVGDGSSPVFLGDGASMTLTNTEVSDRSVVFEKADPASTAQWKLTGDATTADPLTAASIVVTVPAGSTGTIAREATVTEPSLDVVLSNTLVKFLYSQIGTTKNVTITSLLDGTTALADWDWEIVGNTNPAVAVPVSTYGQGPGGNNERIEIKALKPGTTKLTVKVMEFADYPDQQGGLTGRYGLAEITVVVDGPGGTNGGDNGNGGKMPPTGDALSLLAPLALLAGSAVCTYIAADGKKRH